MVKILCRWLFMFLNNRKTSIGDVISVVNRLSVDQEEPTKNIKKKKKKKLPLTKRIFAKILASKNPCTTELDKHKTHPTPHDGKLWEGESKLFIEWGKVPKLIFLFHQNGVVLTADALRHSFSPSGLFYPYQLDESIFHLRCVWYTFSFL